MSILSEIFDHKCAEVAGRQRKKPLAVVRRAAECAPTALGFTSRISLAPLPSLIAEIKRASPSRGVLRADLDPALQAELYLANGARAISILTDEHYFMGSIDDLIHVRNKFPHLPLLQKDFIFDLYQVYEARAAGADAVLLITAQLDPSQLADLSELSQDLGMSSLMEVHNLFELDQALKLQPQLVGINNRNLHTFEVSLETTIQIISHIPHGITVVAESGIHTREDVDVFKRSGVHSLLVGEAIVNACDPGKKVRELAGLPFRAVPSDKDQGSS